MLGLAAGTLQLVVAASKAYSEPIPPLASPPWTTSTQVDGDALDIYALDLDLAAPGPAINASHGGAVSLGGGFLATATMATASAATVTAGGASAVVVRPTGAHSAVTRGLEQLLPTLMQASAHGAALRLVESLTVARALATGHAGATRVGDGITVTIGLRLAHDGVLRLDGATLATVAPPIDASHGSQLRLGGGFVVTLSQATAHQAIVRASDLLTPTMRVSSSHASSVRATDAWVTFVTGGAVSHGGVTRVGGGTVPVSQVTLLDTSSVLRLLDGMLAAILPPIDASHGGRVALGGGILSVQLAHATSSASTQRTPGGSTPAIGLQTAAGGAMRVDGATVPISRVTILDASSVLRLLDAMLAAVLPPIDASHGGRVTLGGGMLSVQLVHATTASGTLRTPGGNTPSIGLQTAAGDRLGLRDLFQVTRLVWTDHGARHRLGLSFAGTIADAGTPVVMRARRWLLPVVLADASLLLATAAPAHVLPVAILPATLSPDDV